MRHGYGVLCVAVFCCALVVQSGRAAAAGSRDIAAERSLKGHTDGVVGLAFFPDNVRLASAGRDKTVRIWDVTSGRLVRTIRGHDGAVTAVSVSADGKIVASASEDHTVRAWDAFTGKQVAQLEGHTGNVEGAAFLPDGTLLTGGGDGVRLWDVAKEQLLWRGGDEGLAVFRMAVSGDGRRAACMGTDGVTRVFDLPGRRLVGRFGQARYRRPVVLLNQDGSELIAPDGKTGVTRWQVAGGKALSLPEDVAGAGGLAFLPGGKRLLAFATIPVGVWDTGTWRRERTLAPDVSQLDWCATVSPDGRRVAIGGGGVFDRNQWQPMGTNLIRIYTLPEPGAAGASASGASGGGGKLTWQESPVRVARLKGGTMDLARWYRAVQDGAMTFDSSAPRRREFGRPRARGIAEGLDALWYVDAVLLYDGKGPMREVLASPGATYTDVVGDGTNVWVASARDGLVVMDRGGRVLGKVGAAQGLPPSDTRLLVYPLAPGRVLAAGAAGGEAPKPGTGWCALVEWDGKTARVNVFFREAQLDKKWDDGRRRVGPFDPVWITEGPPPEGWARSIWVGAAERSQSRAPVLRVDPDTLRFQSYNVRSAERRGPPHDAEWIRGGGAGVPPVRVGARDLVYADLEIYRAPAGPEMVDRADRKSVAKLPESGGPARTPLLLVGGKIYAPGERWTCIDPETSAVEDLGAGLSGSDEPLYFESRVHGLAAVLVRQSTLCRFSVGGAAATRPAAR